MDSGTRRITVLGSAFSIEDAGIFLGCLYFISFILILPVCLQYSNGFVNALEVALVAVVSVVVVHLLLNWLYIATVTVPLIMAGVFAGMGLLVWLFSPIILFVLSAFLDSFLNYSILFSGIELDYSLLNIFISRVGTLLVGIGSWLWWAVKKAKDLNYIALGAYVVLFAIYGALSSINSLSYIALFLIIWYLIYLKVRERANVKDVLKLFRVVATIAVVFGVYAVEIVRVGTSAFTDVYMVNTVGFGESGGYAAFVSLYKNVMGVLILLGIWKPNMFTNLIPETIKNKEAEIIQRSLSFVNIR